MCLNFDKCLNFYFITSKFEFEFRYDQIIYIILSDFHNQFCNLKFCCLFISLHDIELFSTNCLSIFLRNLRISVRLISNCSLISSSFKKCFRFLVSMYFSRLFQTRMILMFLFLSFRKNFRIFQNRANCSKVVFFNFEKLIISIDVKIIMKFEFTKSNIVMIM